MEEFLVAHRQMVTQQKHYLIPVLVENLNPELLQEHPELKLYIKAYTYIDARKLKNENLTDPTKEIIHLRKGIR